MMNLMNLYKEWKGFRIHDYVKIVDKSVGRSLEKQKLSHTWREKGFVNTIDYRDRYRKVIVVVDGNHYLPEDLINLTRAPKKLLQSIEKEVNDIFDLENL